MGASIVLLLELAGLHPRMLGTIYVVPAQLRDRGVAAALACGFRWHVELLADGVPDVRGPGKTAAATKTRPKSPLLERHLPSLPRVKHRSQALPLLICELGAEYSATTTLSYLDISTYLLRHPTSQPTIPRPSVNDCDNSGISTNLPCPNLCVIS